MMNCVRENSESASAAEPAPVNYATTIDTMGNLLVFHPVYRHVDLVCGTMPSVGDSSVIYCAEAAFTGKLLKEFRHSNIMGPHISGGVLHEGYPYDANYGLFAATDSMWQFSVLPDDSLLHAVEQQSGMAFVQYWVIHDGSVYEPMLQKPDRKHIYRVIADMAGELVLIESQDSVAYSEFLTCLDSLHLRNALYMDMGPGWNYSFCRDANDSLIILHPHTHNYTTNWITFYK